MPDLPARSAAGFALLPPGMSRPERDAYVVEAVALRLEGEARELEQRAAVMRQHAEILKAVGGSMGESVRERGGG
jgi:hypothetical protein